MESKREYKNGNVQLASNVKTQYATIDRSIMEEVGADDQEHMALVINYCAMTIGKKGDDIKLHLHTARSESGEAILYTLFVGYPLKTKFNDGQTTFLRSISWRRISRDIELSYEEESNMMIMTICIHPMKYMPEIDEMSITNILLKTKRIHIQHDKAGNQEDGRRGSMKRRHKDADIDK